MLPLVVDDRVGGASLGRLFLRLGDLKSMRDSLVAALVTHAMTNSLPVSAAAGAVNEVRHRIKVMTDDEVVVFDLLRELAAGALYRVWVEQAVLIRAMQHIGEDVEPSAAVRLLRSMRARGILEESAGAWRAVW